MGSVFQADGHHGGITLPWRSILLGAGAVLAYLVLGAAPEDWVFDRVAITQGEWWRLVTGRWVHSDLAHAGWDITALLLLGVVRGAVAVASANSIVDRHCRRRCLVVVG